jgi:hypothetical protein
MPEVAGLAFDDSAIAAGSHDQQASSSYMKAHKTSIILPAAISAHDKWLATFKTLVEQTAVHRVCCFVQQEACLTNS